MGRAVLGDDQPQKFLDRKVRTVDMGNPHLVMFGPDLDDVDVVGHRHPAPVGLRRRHQRRVHRLGRGARQPRRCGCSSGAWARPRPAAPGSAAAAAAAHSWGLVGTEVDVHNPGGTLHVSLADDEILLRGPVHRVASVVVDPVALLAGARPTLSTTA